MLNILIQRGIAPSEGCWGILERDLLRRRFCAVDEITRPSGPPRI